VAQSIEEAKRITMRQALATIYQNMLAKHPSYVKTNFRMLTYGMKENSETMKKAYPDTFARFFFRYVKAISDKKGTGLKLNDIKKRFKKLPAAFIITAGKKRCTMHDISCPTEDCEYVTANKKIIMTSKVQKNARSEPITYRQRIFFRQDLKKRLASIFMTQADQRNCTFEPYTASLKPAIHYNGNKVLGIDKIMNEEVTHNSYKDKLGENFKSGHPEVFKAGKLKKARLYQRQGNFEKATNTLAEGFNIDSLQRRFNPKYIKQLMVKAMMEK